MDLGTIIGLITGMTLVVLSMAAGTGLGLFIDVPSLMITVGGTIAASFISFPMKVVLGGIAVFRKTVLFKMDALPDLIKTIVGYAEKARKEGMLALEEESESEPNEFLRMGLRMAVDGTDPQLLQRIMENDMEALEYRHDLGVKYVTGLGTAAPAFGMIGTLVGLVKMLANMSDPSALGAGMAVALLTTFYGAFMANLLFLPLADKLKARAAEEMQVRGLVIEGIIAIQSGDSPRVVEEKLKSFLAPKDRAALSKDAA